LGSTPWRVFRTITIPNLTPSILASACVVFVFSFTSLGIVTILGDGSTTRTLEQVILRQSSVLLDFPGALASAILQLVVVSSALFIAARSRGTALTLRTGNSTRTHYLIRITSKKTGLWVFTIASLAGVFVVAPIASIVWASLSGRDGFTLAWWISLQDSSDAFSRLGSPLHALGLSVVLAIFTALTAAFVGGAIAIAVMGRNPFIAFLSLIPLGLSAATVGLGTLLAFGRAPIDLRASGALIPIAHALVAVPLVVALAAPVLRAADPRRMFVASSLGASPNRAWWTAYGNVIRMVMLAAGGLAGAVSLGEFGAATFLARPDSPTVPVQISKLLTRPGEQAYATAAVLSVTLIIATLTLMLIVDRMNSKVRL
jgi:thiamine transport system permease protein